jgi:hypothetical protein
MGRIRLVTARAPAGVKGDVPLSIAAILLVVLARAAFARALAPPPRAPVQADAGDRRTAGAGA